MATRVGMLGFLFGIAFAAALFANSSPAAIDAPEKGQPFGQNSKEEPLLGLPGNIKVPRNSFAAWRPSVRADA